MSWLLSRSYRSVGDELFIKAFEDTTLAFEEWDHQAHLQMAWNYIKEYGKEKATPMIKWAVFAMEYYNKWGVFETAATTTI